MKTAEQYEYDYEHRPDEQSGAEYFQQAIEDTRADMFYFVRWFNTFSKKLSRVRYYQASNRWYFVICNAQNKIAHIEMFTDQELYNRYKEETK
jgi:hypothetical protein